MNIIYHYPIAFLIRIVLIIYGTIQDNVFFIKYTDIDYQVFTDAAEYVLNGSSPYRRHTYRYTPILAYMLVPNISCHTVFGKILFCALDISTSILIYQILVSYGHGSEICKKCSFMWLYNPVTMIISSRGNAESVMTTLVMLSIYLFKQDKSVLCGLIYGLSVHFKIYPCIYALSFYFSFSSNVNKQQNTWEKFKYLFIPNQKKMLFILSSAIGFAIPTIIAAIMYSKEYFNEAFLYHLIRKDIRHNFSPYFYLLYLLEGTNNHLSGFLSIWVFFIQFSLISFTAWIFHRPHLLPVTLFIQTFLFVTLNKVCTSQYFLWYLCLFPLTYPLLKVNVKQIAVSFIVWILSQGLWLLPAYYLEFQGKNVFLFICLASLVFYSVNMYLICVFIKSLKLDHYKEINQKNE